MKTKLPPLAEVLDLLPDAVCVVDVDNRLLFVNASFGRILGYAPDALLGQRMFDLIHPDDREATMRQAEQVTAGAPQRHFRNRYIHRDGHSVDIQWSARWLPDYDVRIGVGREATELRRRERELEHFASHDALTGLANRRRLQSELQSSITRALATDDGLTVLYLDLDGFKAVNDRGGHGAGDHVLREVAQRLREGLRHGDFVARVGGDEFVALLSGYRNAEAAQAMVDRLQACLSPPYLLPDGFFELDASVGLACFPADGDDPDTLLAHADRAMYTAKRRRLQHGDGNPLRANTGDA